MQTDHTSQAVPDSPTLRTAITLAELLQRVDAAPLTVSPGQYQALVRHLDQLLDSLPPGPVLQRLLATFPAASTVYENRHYGHAGLCRAPLDQSLNSELAARQLIERVQATRA